MALESGLLEEFGAWASAPQFVGSESPGNLLIQGDNLPVLEALLPTIESRIRCVYIDPPYNNSESYAHYDDREPHEAWLNGIEQRLDLLGRTLTPDGSLWISIDDGGAHYLKVAADRVLGRERFVATVVWEHRTTRENRTAFSVNHEYILVYAADPATFATTRNDLPLTKDVLARYKNPDDDPRGPWQSVTANVQDGHATASQYYEIVAPGGKKHRPPNGRCWVYTEERMREEIAKGNIYFGAGGNGVPRIKKFLSEARRGLTPMTLWPAAEVGTTKAAKKHILKLFPGEAPFDTPKPESLIQRIVEIATDPGDLVLDAYLGSGTTAAVAHKLGRRYIGIESGDHAASLCLERMRAVVDGETGGISEDVDWRGGGDCAFIVASLQAHRS